MSDINQEVDYKVDLSKPPVKKEEVESKEKEQETPEVAEEKAATEEVKEENKEQQEVVEEQKPEAEEKEVVVQEEKKEEKPEEPRTPSKEEVIAEFLTQKYSMGLEELDNVLLNNENKSQELPEEVEKYLEYKKETRRGLKDFVKANEDVSDYEETTLLREYYKQSNPGLDDSDIDYLIEDKFTVDENIDTYKDKKRKSLEKKQELHKAKQYFKDIQEKYKAPLESSTENLPEEVEKAVEFYKQYSDESAKQQKEVDMQRQTFQKKTSELFSDNFEGFEFNLGEKKLNYKPKDVNEVMQKQSDLNNFISKFLDENGVLKDAKKYHTALNMAMNPEAYAKFFYEQGKADAVNEVVKDGKNISMDVRSNVDSSKPGTKFRVINDGSSFGSGLKIRKK